MLLLDIPLSLPLRLLIVVSHMSCQSCQSCHPINGLTHASALYLRSWSAIPWQDLQEARHALVKPYDDVAHTECRAYVGIEQRAFFLQARRITTVVVGVEDFVGHVSVIWIAVAFERLWRASPIVCDRPIKLFLTHDM
jgi:hypothetical protein